MTECNNYRVLDTPIWAPRQALFRDSRSTCFCLPKTEVKRGERSPDADVVEPFFCPLPCVSRILVYSALAIGLLSPLSQKYERMYMVTRYRRPPSAAVTKISKRGALVLVQYVHTRTTARTHASQITTSISHCFGGPQKKGGHSGTAGIKSRPSRARLNFSSPKTFGLGSTPRRAPAYIRGPRFLGKPKKKLNKKGQGHQRKSQFSSFPQRSTRLAACIASLQVDRSRGINAP